MVTPFTLGPLSSIVICMLPSVSSCDCKLLRVSSTLTRNRRFCLRVVSSDHRPQVSKIILDSIGWGDLLPHTMTSSAKRLLQTQSLHLLHETILRSHCCELMLIEIGGPNPIGSIPGRRCESGPRPLCPCDGRLRSMFWHHRRHGNHRWNRSGSVYRAPCARPCRCQTSPAIGIEDVGFGAIGIRGCLRMTGGSRLWSGGQNTDGGDEGNKDRLWRSGVV